MGWRQFKFAKFCSLLYVTKNSISAYTTVGCSMEPSFNEKDVVIVEKISAGVGRWKPGDIVVARDPETLSDSEERVCKRIKAVGGEIYPVIRCAKEGLVEYLRVPYGFVWLEGDNNQWSYDSRAYGFVPMTMLEGKVIWRLPPFLSSFLPAIL